MSLKEQCFAQGFQTAFTKQAISARGAAAVMPAVSDMELEALGRRLFHESYHSPGLWKGIRSTLFSGYGQLRGIHDLRAKGLPETSDFLQNAYTRLGQTAKPRLDKLNNYTHVGMGLGAGGLAGAALGRYKGQDEEHDQLAQALGKAPLIERLKYLIAPQQFTGTQPAQEDY